MPVIVPNSWANSYSIDWVKPDTPASELGYLLQSMAYSIIDWAECGR